MMVQSDSASTLTDSSMTDPGHLSFLESRLGATRTADGHCEFLVWAPAVSRVEVRILGDVERIVRLIPESQGYHQGAVDGVEPNALYTYRLEGDKERPDPASRFQPQGVLGPSQVAEVSVFEWSDQAWRGLRLEDYIFYELHTGAYTGEGTFDACD